MLCAWYGLAGAGWKVVRGSLGMTAALAVMDGQAFEGSLSFHSNRCQVLINNMFSLTYAIWRGCLDGRQSWIPPHLACSLF